MSLEVTDHGTHTVCVCEVPHSRATHIQVAYRAGARYETAAQNGLAHFLEHVVHKGGKNYRSYEAIRDRADELGAYRNAVTSAEGVRFHITVRRELASEGFDLLSDFLARPLLPADEIEKEKSVITQELRAALDRPKTRLYYASIAQLFGDHPLGRKILGSEETIQSFTPKDCRDYLSSKLQKPLFVVSGNTQDFELSQLAERFEISGSQPEREPSPAPAREPNTRVVAEDTKQSHLRIAYPLPEFTNTVRGRSAGATWSSALSKRLFNEIRGKQGLCYGISAEIQNRADNHFLVVSSGLDSSRCVDAYREINRMVSQMVSQGLGEDEYRRIVANRIGHKIIAFETAPALGDAIAGTWADLGEIVDPDETMDLLDEVTRDEVNAAAQSMGPPQLTCLGPHTEEEFVAATEWA